MAGCKLLESRHCLIIHKLGHIEGALVKELAHLTSNFCGRVLHIDEGPFEFSEEMIVYFCGNVQSFLLQCGDHASIKARKIRVVEELSVKPVNAVWPLAMSMVSMGQVPLSVHGLGLFIRRQFSEDDYFQRLTDARNGGHQFQTLTESNKPGTSFRKGIYLSPITSVLDSEDEGKNEGKSESGSLSFHLMRCSTNLGGPTDNFRDVDAHIVQTVAGTVKEFFDRPAPLNHVLAQIYENVIVPSKGAPAKRSQDRKAAIGEHSDKTEDMDENGVIAFTSFYSGGDKRVVVSADGYDRLYKGQSVLTQLCFRLKDDPSVVQLPCEFRVTLFPNSVFIIPLSTNRLYTHRTVPSRLGVGLIPTRLGYVIRCSKTKAMFRENDGKIHVAGPNGWVPLEKPTDEKVRVLKALYLLENTTANTIEYPSVLDYSLNDGDYLRPIA